MSLTLNSAYQYECLQTAILEVNVDFSEMISTGWRNHSDDPEGVTDLLNKNVGLVDSADKLARFGALLVHHFGGHLTRWDTAETLFTGVIEPFRAGLDDVQVLVLQAICQYMNGNQHALSTEAQAIALSPNSPFAPITLIRVRLAEALLCTGQLELGATVARTALQLLNEGLPEGSERTVAVSMNNIASELVERSPRTSDEDALMLETALVAQRAWQAAGSWVNWERADYLLAFVHNATGSHDKALLVADHGLDLIRANNGEEKVDEAFLRLQKAAALKHSGRQQESSDELERAVSLVREVGEDWLDDWFADVRQKLAM